MISTENRKRNTLKLKKAKSADAFNIIDVQRIFQGKKKVALQHNGDRYTLQITGNDKLLLTK